jgi:crossover junction endodeoxyribonuclease RuvC
MAAGVGLCLGVDPGLAHTGWALIDANGDVVTCGTVVTSPGPVGPRLVSIVTALREVLAAHPVAEAALEELFLGRNATSAIAVAQARGAVLTVLAGAGVPTYEYKPAQVKSTVTGYGMAGKRQMARMLALQGISRPGMDDHAADAVAIALCHARSRRLRAAPASRPPRPGPPAPRDPRDIARLRGLGGGRETCAREDGEVVEP